MSSYCPDWIFNLSSGMIATEFIAKNTTLPALSHKYVDAISKEYEKIDPELFQEAAEQYILMLNELEVGEASFDYLTGFCCYKINFVNPKTKRNLTGLFSKELKGTATAQLSPTASFVSSINSRNRRTRFSRLPPYSSVRLLTLRERK